MAGLIGLRDCSSSSSQDSLCWWSSTHCDTAIGNRQLRCDFFGVKILFFGFLILGMV
jgi:hypothetical protein